MIRQGHGLNDRMARATLMACCVFVGCALMGIAQAQSPQANLIEVPLDRKENFFSSSPAVIKAIALSDANQPSGGTALLWFRGWPGMTQIRSVTDWRERGSLNFFLKSMDVLFARGITLVMVDCPTDQWGVGQGNPLSCDDAFRESEAHANDVRQIMAVLKTQYGIQKFFVMGHSYGTISSRWLALRLGHEIAGSIHSASMTGSVRMPLARFGASVSRMDMSKVLAPYVFLHNEDDQCVNTSFKAIQAWHGSKLITLHGGEPSGDVCGGKHYHSYAGIEAQAAQAVVDWIREQEAPARAQ